MTYGNKRDYRKIDIYVKNAGGKTYNYVASTTWCNTCKEAAKRYADKVKIQPAYVKAFFNTK